MKYIAYNPHSGNGKSLEMAKSYAQKEGAQLVDITEIENCALFMEKLGADDEFILYGGDGTLNRFVNDIGDNKYVKSFVAYADRTASPSLSLRV